MIDILYIQTNQLFKGHHMKIKASTIGMLGAFALSGCYSTQSTAYDPYAGASAYRSPPPRSATPSRSTHQTQRAPVSGNHHGNYVTPPPAAPIRRSTGSTSGDPGKPFQFPKFEVEKPGATCGYPRTDCTIYPKTAPSTRPSKVIGPTIQDV